MIKKYFLGNIYGVLIYLEEKGGIGGRILGGIDWEGVVSGM